MCAFEHIAENTENQPPTMILPPRRTTLALFQPSHFPGSARVPRALSGVTPDYGLVKTQFLT